ncbi:hypothetical protein ABIA40_006022 [Bradyrhizobium sp. USDA 223]
MRADPQLSERPGAARSVDSLQLAAAIHLGPGTQAPPRAPLPLPLLRHKGSPP